MGKLKKSLSLSILGILSCCSITGGILLSNKNLKKDYVISVADTDVAISNTNTPNWFDTAETSTDVFDQDTFFPASSNDSLILKFKTTTEKIVSDKNAYLYYPNGEENSQEFILFSNMSYSLSREGEALDITNGTGVISGKAGNTLQTDIISQTFNLTLKLDTTQTKTSWDDTNKNGLTLYEEGIYNLSITYTAFYVNDYDNTAKTYSFDHEESFTTSYTFRVFNKSTYLNTDNSPKVSYNDATTRTQTTSATTQYNYFYNYQSDKASELTFNPKLYSIRITKDLDDDYSYMKLKYDKETDEVISSNEDITSSSTYDDTIVEYVYDKSGSILTLRFKNIGQYLLDYELVYTTDNNEHYTIPKIKDSYAKAQTMYVFGYQASYTQYDRKTNSNFYPEFKKYQKDNLSEIDSSADITSKINSKFYDNNTGELNDFSTDWVTDTITPVSTNQTPVRLNGYANLDTLKKVQLYKYNSEKEEWGGPTTVDLSKKYSEKGTYLLVLKYTFSGYTTDSGSASNKGFYQVFYFTIENETPSVEVELSDGTSYTNLPSGKFTNQDVYITNNQSGDTYNSDVIIKIQRTDFTNNNTITTNDLSKYYDEGTSKYKVTENGNYVIKIYYGREGIDGRPITRSFTIDKTEISSPTAYSVTANNSQYFKNTEIQGDIAITNEAIAFEWESTKTSGASTYAYYKYFPIKKNDTNWTSSQLIDFIGFNFIPSGYELDLSQSASWIYYNNTEGLNKFSQTQVRSNAGLYILQVFDEAGNSTVKFFVIDNTSPKFVASYSDGTYTYLDSITKKVSEDVTIYWTKNKGILLTEQSKNSVTTNKDGDADDLIKSAYNNFLTTYRPDTYVDGEHKLFAIPIDNTVYIRDERSYGAEYRQFTDVYSYNIDFSYSLYYTESSNGTITYYYSSSDPYTFYEANLMNETRGEKIITDIDGNINGLKPILYTGSLYNSTVDLDGKNYIFLIRDKSNTEGLNEKEAQRYINYSSASQRIFVSSDESELQFNIESNEEYLAISRDGVADHSDYLYKSDNFNSTPSNDNLTKIENDYVYSYRYKDSYNYPTNVNKEIYVSFKPSVEVENEKFTQVESVSVVYTPFTTKYSVSDDGRFTAYKTWGEPEDEYYIYQYSGTKETEIKRISLNVTSQIVNGSYTSLTKEGKYEITRKYRIPADDNEFNVNQYDFLWRTLTLYVDRYGVISSPEQVQDPTITDTYGDITLTYAGNILTSNIELGSGQSYYAKITLTDGSIYQTNSTLEKAEVTVSGKKYTFHKGNISNVELFKADNTALTPDQNIQSTSSSVQSIVGNGILVNMYSNSNQSEIAVQFPSYLNTGLSSGESFYTNSKTENVSIFTTNKIPFSIKIPENKYTYGYTKDTNNNISIKQNDTLAEYYQGVSIEQYKLYAEITFKGDNGQIKTYKSSGTKNGYLQFDQFYTPGTYTVSILQAPNETAVDKELSFKQTAKFTFRVEETTPSFELTLTNGQSLGSRSNTYYTNQKTVGVRWTDSNSNYMVNIDKQNIVLKVGNQEYNLKIQKDVNTWKVISAPQTKDIFKFKKVENSLENILTIDLDKLGIYKNQESFDITMQFEGHNEEYYKTTTKTLQVDTQADTTRIDSLISKTGKLQESDVRTILDIDGDVVSGKAPYNVSKDSERYKYYSYIVDEDFLSTLKNTIISPNATSTNNIYYKKIEYNDTFTETKYNGFVEYNYTKIENEAWETGNFYEIVEEDLAGNLTIYIVKYYEEGEIEFNNSNLSDSEIMEGNQNIYSYEGLSLKSVNFKSDPWIFFDIVEYKNNHENVTHYMKSPWIDKNKAFNLDTGEAVTLTDIVNFPTNENKRQMIIYDREEGNKYTIYISVITSSNLNIYSLVENNVEGISISVSNLPSSNKVGVFPTEVKVAYGSNSYTLENTSVANYSNPNSWTGDTNLFDIEYNNGWLIKLKAPQVNTKYKYTITDNFGKSYNHIHLYGSKFTEKIDTVTDVYEIYDTYEDNIELFYLLSGKEFVYSYNPTIYDVEVVSETNRIDSSITPKNSIERGSYKELKLTWKGDQIDQKVKISVKEKDNDEIVKELYIYFYNQLPIQNSENNKVSFKDDNGTDLNLIASNEEENITLSGKTYSVGYKSSVYAKNLTMTYTITGTNKYPFKATIFSVQNNEFVEGVVSPSGTKLVSVQESLKDPGTTYYILFTYENEEILKNDYVLYSVTINDPTSSFFYVTYDGNDITPSKNPYIHDNIEYSSNYYQINVSKENAPAIENIIITNKYQGVRIIKSQQIGNVTGVITYKYELTNFTGDNYTEPPTTYSPYKEYVIISYVTPTSNPTTVRYAGKIINNPTEYVVYEKGVNNERMQISWTKYYGISSNTVEIEVKKDGRNFPISYTSNGDTYVATFDISGTYEITFKDSSGNIKKFGDNNYLTLTFLKDVHFTMSYVDELGNSIQSEAIDRGVFNSEIKLQLQGINNYYTTESIGNTSSIIHAKKNGIEYIPTYDTETQTFTFSESGHYQIYFSAISLYNNKEIQEKTYTFTILNKNESRYAYEYTGLNDYQISKVIFNDGVNVIEQEEELWKNNISKSYYNDNGKEAGLWTITVTTGRKLIFSENEYNESDTSFTFSFLIRSNIPPIDVSIIEGEISTAEITVSFRAENVYNSVGDCLVYITQNPSSSNLSPDYVINSDTISSLSVINHVITDSGTYYIQVRTNSGNLLYSYIVTKKTPLNTWAIIAIVLGCIAGIGILFLVLRLRKRIKIK